MAIRRTYRSLLRVGTVVIGVVAAKVAVHLLGWEVISMNPLFSGVIAANVFLMGFLLSGVLADFKESERIPGEIASSLESLTQEVRGIRMVRPDADVAPCLLHVVDLGRALMRWFHKKTSTGELISALNDLTPHLAAVETWSQATLIARLKQEQATLRRMILRVETIRETSFVASGYVLADVVTGLVCAGLVLCKISELVQSIFFVTIISYMMIFVLRLIRDLDNPFGYYETSSSEDVSLEPIESALERIESVAKAESAPRAAAIARG